MLFKYDHDLTWITRKLTDSDGHRLYNVTTSSDRYYNTRGEKPVEMGIFPGTGSHQLEIRFTSVGSRPMGLGPTSKRSPLVKPSLLLLADILRTTAQID